MAAPVDSGYGVGVAEDVKTVDNDEVQRHAAKVVSGLAGAGVGEGEAKNGSDACPEGAGSDEHGDEEQVAKKPRVEKVETEENGGADKAGGDGYGVESVEGVVDKDGGENGVNGSGEAVGEGEEEVDNGVVGAVEEEAATEGEGVTGKGAAPGDVGLRTLLQEGDDTKTSVAHHGADATHMLNGAK